MIVTTNYLAEQILANLTQSSGAGCLHDCYIGLYQSNTLLTNSTILASLTEATYDGYARVEITAWGDVYLQPDGSQAMNAPLVQFQPSDSVVPNTIYGYMVVSTSGSTANLLFAEALSSPASMASSDDAVLVSTNFSFGSPDNSNGSALVASS